MCHGVVEERQEEDLGPPHHHPHPEGEQHEGVGHHRGLPHKEGGAVDVALAPAVHDGAEASFNGTTLAEGALPYSEVTQRIKEAMEPSRDDAGTPSISSTRCQDIL